MEAQWIAQRAALRWLVHQHPQWTHRQLADWLGVSRSFVKKWLTRFRMVSAADVQVLFSRSRARKTPPLPPHPRIVERIIEIRTHPPENLHRTPGPRAILYYLHRDTDLQAQGLVLPRSTRTIWKILRQQGYILDEAERIHEPLEPREPLEEVQMDFKDASSVPADPQGKQQHVVEILNFVDAGTSILLSSQVHEDFHAETALEAVIAFLQQYGMPPMLTFDRDPRWVGSASGRDFPSALRRFLLCVGIEPHLCPPHRPDKNPFVERFHRALSQECLQVQRPTTLQAVREAVEPFVHHYNHERPHQGRSCQNQPPCIAHPTLPVRPPLPATVDPDGWLLHLHGQAFARKVKANGCVEVDLEPYYLEQALAKTSVVLVVNAPQKLFEVYQGSTLIKQVPVKGLHGTVLPFDRYATLITQEARSEQRRLAIRKRAVQQLPLWA